MKEINWQYQQHPFFFCLSFFLFVIFVVGTYTGMKLFLVKKCTFLIVCSRLRPMRSLRKQRKLLHCSWHLFANAWFLDVLPRIRSQPLLQLISHQIDRFCFPPKWRGIFQALLEILDSKTLESTIRCYRKTLV